MITSSQNEQLKALRKLRHKKHRERTESFAAEGEDLVFSALAAGRTPSVLFCTPDAPPALSGRTESVAVSQEVLDGVSGLGSGSRVIGVFEQRWSVPGSEFRLAVFLDGVADPGNVGAVLRSALAFADGPVILGPGCADPFSPKAVRAAMGALFARPPARASVAELTGLPARLIALDASGVVAVRDFAAGGTQGGENALEKQEPTVICVGAEREGLSEETLAAAAQTVSIGMRSAGPQSLNAAVAASIALYEIGRVLQERVHAGSDAAAVTGNPRPIEK